MAPVTLSNVLANGSTTSGTTFTTGSATPIAGRVYLLGWSSYNSSGSTQPPTPSISGTNGWSGATWQLVHATNGKADFDTSGTDRSSLFLFYSKDVPGGSAGTLTATFGSSVSRSAWTLDVTDANVDVTSPIVQVPAPAIVSATTSASVTLSAFGDATNNAAYAVAGHQANEATTAEGTSLSSFAQSVNSIGSEYYSGGSDLTASMSWTTSSRAGLIAVEIKAAAAATSPIFRRDPSRGLYMR